MGYDGSPGIDLHIHSTASDGTLTPDQILLQAGQLGLKAIAITDHDTIEGSHQAVAGNTSASLKCITGVEISSNPPFPTQSMGSLHILGYGIQVRHAALNKALHHLQDARKNRNPAILERLTRLGISLSMDDIRDLTGPGQLGRPHIARALIDRGIVKNMDEAFERFLGKNRPAYVDKSRIPCEDAIRLIREAGGIPVLAHPGILKQNNMDDLFQLVLVLKEMGLMGIEAYYPQHTQDQIDQYIRLAGQMELLLTGGTDFHGAMHPDIRMGVGRGQTHVPYSLFETLTKQLEAV